jgi:hypothetical protein
MGFLHCPPEPGPQQFAHFGAQVMMKDADDVPGLVSSKAGLKYAGASPS